MGFLAMVTFALSICFWVLLGATVVQGFDPIKVLMIIGVFVALVCSFLAIFIVSDTKHFDVDDDYNDLDDDDHIDFKENKLSIQENNQTEGD